ncbi:MAG TPA: ABC transporter permease [Gemmatimonadales bacterium]|jgi:putative ABC transport system permease protein
MLIGETVRVAFGSIRANKLRAALTMLGVIIGVAAVITVVAMGSGAQKAVQDRINALGANLVTINPGMGRGVGGVASADRAAMHVADADSLRTEATTLDAVVPELSRNQQVVYLNNNINTSIVGTTANYVSAHNYTITYGRNFTDGDDASRQRYAVVGSDVPKLLNANPAAVVGQSIAIRQIPFEIIGVLSSKGSQGFQNPDEQILIPLSTARFRVFGNDLLRSISVIVNTKVPLERGMVDIERILRKQHKIRPGQDDNFQIRSPKDILATQQQTAETFSTLLLSIAAVSLLVGGIGIMNIMLVSVTERTKEIGIRKALGATRFTIMAQFLVEALVLCVSGGTLGIIIGVGASIFVSKQYGTTTVISPVAIASSFVFSGLVGLFFGLWPARRAASLDPIAALRYE